MRQPVGAAGLGGKGKKGDSRRGKRRRECEGPSLVVERWQFVIS